LESKVEKNNENQISIKIARKTGKKVVKVVEKMKIAGIKVLREEKWQVKKDLILKKEKVYVPKDKELRVKII